MVEQAEEFGRKVSAFELGRIMCKRAEVEHYAGAPTDAQRALDEAKSLRSKLELDDDSPLSKKIRGVEELLRSSGK